MRSKDFLPHPVEKAVLRLFEDLATPVSLKVSLLWRAGDWDQISKMEIDPLHYDDAERFWRDAMAINVVRKLEDLPTTHDRKAVAERNFELAESQCCRSNIRLLPYLSPGLPETDEGVLRFIARARKICESILGPFVDTHTTRDTRQGSLRYVIKGQFGPGSTYGDRGRFTTIPDKMSSVPTLTTRSRYYLLPWSDTLWAQASRRLGNRPAFVDGNRFTTVSKDSTKDRGIAVEPSVNLFYQLAYGKYIRSRLKLSGINLEKGQDIHALKAREASIEGHLATLDLSNASDTICINLVKLILPPKWFEALNDLRSHKTLFKGSWRLLEKFSSMGNGFTFELETLLFLCLIIACDDTGHKLVPGVNVFVYGDDLIMPVESSRDVIAALSFFGMAVNKRKSFVDGPFRESCGGDFFLGVDVRPFFLKESPSEPQQLISFANGLMESCKGYSHRSSALRRTWFDVLDGLPSHIRSLRGPKDLGDLCIHDDESRWQFRWRSGIRWLRVYRPARYRKVSWKFFKPEVILASAVYGVPSGVNSAKDQNLGGVIPRDAVSGYKVGWVAYS